MLHPWSIPGSDQQPILGDTHVPADQPPRGVLIICHGFKGYKDYGILPGIAHYAAMHGFIAHRFNFSHSGMTNQLETFERPDLFEKDTWSRQIFDLQQVARAAADSTSPLTPPSSPLVAASRRTSPLPQIWFGHSRGGVTALLAAARAFAPQHFARHPSTPKLAPAPQPAGVIACAAPHRSIWLGEEERARLRTQGYLDSPSARTKQVLRIGKAWLDEIEADPNAFDPLAAARRIACPLLIVHGSDDMTVPLASAEALAAAAPHARLEIVQDATHVFNTANPMKLDREPSPQAAQLISLVCSFCQRVSA